MQRTLALLPALFLLSSCYKPNWKQPRLLLSFWFDPLVPKEEFPQRYQEIAECNFTAVMGGFGAKTPDMVEAQLAASEAVGLGVIAAAAAGISDYSNSSALWGYQLKDEPAAREFPGLRAWTDNISEAHPDKLRYINLLPSCPPAQMNATDYDTYVKEFVKQVEPDVLSMDHYPNFAIAHNASGINMDGYRADLAVMRKYSLLAGIPFWNYFGVEHVFGGQPVPTEAQLRWQMFTSLAYGAKGLLYFCYWGGMLQTVTPIDDKNATPILVLNHQYARAKRINTHILAYEKHLMQATSTAVWYVSEGGQPSPGSPSMALSTGDSALVIAIKNVEGMGPALPFLIGQFHLEDGRTAVMLQNQDVTFDAVPDITFRRASSSRYLCEVSSVTGKEEPLLSGLVIEAGSAVLIVASSSPCSAPGARAMLI